VEPSVWVFCSSFALPIRLRNIHNPLRNAFLNLSKKNDDDISLYLQKQQMTNANVEEKERKTNRTVKLTISLQK